MRPLANIFLKWMKGWDYAAAQRVDFFIANSQEVKKRIQKYYNRDSVVIYPPIDTEFWFGARHPGPFSQTEGRPERGQTGGEFGAVSGRRGNLPQNNIASDAPAMAKQGYFLLAGRLQAHKRNDLIIEIFNELGLRLHVVGTGRQEQYLKSIARPNITFYGRVSDEELRTQYQEAQGFIYPQIEDAGLMPLEAAACGTATIGIAKGGSLETIVPGVTGELFEDYNKEKIKQIILAWNPEKYSADGLRRHAEKFSKKKFTDEILKFINSK